MALFESYERRINQIQPVLEKYGMETIEDAKVVCENLGIDPYTIVKETQPIAFENAGWAYTLGAAIAIKKGCKTAADAAEAIGEGLQAFCIPGSVADDRKVGLGHGNLGAMLLRDETKNEQAFTEGRIIQLENMLKNAVVVDESEISTDIVTVGSIVKVMDFDFDEEVEYSIVGSAEADPMNFKISNESPVGEGLMGKKVGDVVEIEVPGGTTKFEVLGIRR